MTTEFYPPDDPLEKARWKVIKLGDAANSLAFILPKLSEKLKNQMIAAKEEYKELELYYEQQKQLRQAGSTRYKKTAIPNELRWQVFERDNYTCQHCGSRKHLSVDHILAESKGGLMVLENLQTLCSSCNSRKGAK